MARIGGHHWQQRQVCTCLQPCRLRGQAGVYSVVAQQLLSLAQPLLNSCSVVPTSLHQACRVKLFVPLLQRVASSAQGVDGSKKGFGLTSHMSKRRV